MDVYIINLWPIYIVICAVVLTLALVLCIYFRIKKMKKNGETMANIKDYFVMRLLTFFFIKTPLIICLFFFALFNYRYISFDKGYSTVEINNQRSVKIVASFINDPTTKIEYYKKTIPDDSYQYKVYLVTSGDAYLLDATEEDIQMLDTIGLLSSNVIPQKITPIPFYVEIIIGLFILFFPFGKRKSSN